MKKLLFSVLFFTFLAAHAQEEVAAVEVSEDDLGVVSDAFKENFFDALSLKARENHDRAIEKLLICERLEPDNGAVQFELAKNYMASNAFAKAETHLLAAINISGEREWLLDNLLEVYNQQQEYSKAVNVLEKLAKDNVNYQELLPVAYLRISNKEKALAVIEDLDQKLGLNERRSVLRRSLQNNQQQEERITGNLEELEEKLAVDPDNEQLYIQLIYGYSRINNMDKTQEFAEKLSDALPDSDSAQVALYKIYLESGELETGLQSMKRIFESAGLEESLKVEVLKDFLATAKNNPALSAYIQPAIEDFKDNVESIDAYLALGDHYKEEKQLQAAVSFYETAMELNNQDFELIKTTALLYLDTGAFAKAETLSTAALESFPTQPLLYLINGAALNKLGDFKKAINQLETGLSFLLDEPQLEKDIYGQLVVAYEKLGDAAKAKEAQLKMNSMGN
ncbi:tetratricopeptide repeat protein [Nonlabens marinus]|uniref:TPR domain protein n=1 Tax=Nonlabens marinus S1-08 TaxID=1454201 RepID=W8VPZ8_9FLAO|nr:tetratricopeptide repeat protein [Nonlabens marinus]BAO54750.1 TPR domain protein [Nonlabens marinus S1-08]